MKTRWKSVLIGSVLLLILPITGILSEEIQKESRGGCLIKSAFQTNCPFCGMTRAFSFAAHGDLAKANQLNPGWSVALFIIVALGILHLLDGFTEKTRIEAFWAKIASQFWVFICLGATFTIIRALL